ncbi:MAG: phage portal protein, partial [Nanoarchaeota archaeon]|nr:phage portal protein [Nanoarchaeota archaeon]
MAFTDIFRINKLKRVLYETFFFNGTPLNEPRSFKNDLMSGYLDNEVSYSVINKIAQTAASVPYKLVDKNDKEVKSHWILDLLEYPNPDNTFKEIYYAHIIYLYSIGNSYIYSPLLNENKRKSLWIVPSEEVSIIKGNYIEPIKGYKIYNGDNQIVMDKKDIFFNKLFNPRFNGGQWLYG